MIKPECPNCKSNENVVLMGIGFRCAFCGKRFFAGDIISGKHEVQTKLNCSISNIE